VLQELEGTDILVTEGWENRAASGVFFSSGM
jgi:hypothetical protein